MYNFKGSKKTTGKMAGSPRSSLLLHACPLPGKPGSQEELPPRCLTLASAVTRLTIRLGQRDEVLICSSDAVTPRPPGGEWQGRSPALASLTRRLVQNRTARYFQPWVLGAVSYAIDSSFRGVGGG